MNEENNEAKEMKFDLEVAPMESITKAEIDVQISTALAHPRSLAQFYRRAEAMITADQDTAESCFFKITKGGKVIEGESIRMAEIVASCYGNLRSAVHISGYTPTRVSVRAVCHDLETNNLIAVEKQSKTTYSDGRPYNEDMAVTIANATISKALRDAIFRVVPKALLKPLREKAKLVAFGTGQAFIDRRKKAFDWATVTRKVPADRVFAVLGVKGIEDMSVEHLEILTGLKNAIMEGDQTVDEAFPPIVDAKPMFDHPAKKEQESEQKATEKADPKKGSAIKTKPLPVPEPKVLPKTEPPIVGGDVTVKEAEQAAVLAGPPVEATKPEPLSEPQPPGIPESELPPELMPEPEPEKEKVATESQLKLKDEITAAGFTFEDLGGWARTTPMPLFKTNPPKRWEDIPDDKAKFFVAQIKGIAAAIKGWKAKK
jgi:hypothetical protein